MPTKKGSTNFYGIMHFYGLGFDEEKEMILQLVTSIERQRFLIIAVFQTK